MKCRNCDADLASNAESCPWCGSSDPFGVEASPDVASQPPSPDKVPSTRPSKPLAQPVPPVQPKRKLPVWLIFVLVIVGVLICGCVVFFGGSLLLGLLGTTGGVG